MVGNTKTMELVETQSRKSFLGCSLGDNKTKHILSFQDGVLSGMD